MNYSNIKSEGLQGVDVSKEITLKEYGFGYHVLPKKGIYRFYIGDLDSIKRDKEVGHEFTWFECIELPLEVDIEVEFDFINVQDVSSFVGLSRAEWLEAEAPSKLYDAISYYGYDNF